MATAAVPAALTRGLHLDGLADTADGLGSAKPAEDALRIMKQSDIGPFGVITLLFVLLAQVAVLFQLYEAVMDPGCARRRRLGGRRPAGPHAGRPHGRPPGPAGGARARPWPERSRAGAALLAAGLVTVLRRARRALPFGAVEAVRSAAAVVLAPGAAELLLRHCVRRSAASPATSSARSPRPRPRRPWWSSPSADLDRRAGRVAARNVKAADTNG